MENLENKPLQPEIKVTLTNQVVTETGEIIPMSIESVVQPIVVAPITPVGESTEIDTKALHDGLTKKSKIQLWWYEIKLRFRTKSNHLFCVMASRMLKLGKACLAMLIAFAGIKAVVPDFIIPQLVTGALIFFTGGGIFAWAMASFTVSDEYKKDLKEDVTSYGEFLKKAQSGQIFNSEPPTK